MDLERSIIELLREKSVRVETIMEHCHRVDRNRDGVIHVNDFRKILDQLLGIYTLSKRQMMFVISNLVCDEQHMFLEYERLDSVIDSRRMNLDSHNAELVEDWDCTSHALSPLPSSHTDGMGLRGHFTRGSLGQWIEEQSCPAEIENLELFTALLETYERRSGLRIQQDPQGNLVVPLGPDLMATLQYSLRR